MLNDIIKMQKVKAHGVVAIYPANQVDEDDIEVYTAEGENLGKLYTLRQQRVDDTKDFYMAMSDFVAPKQSGIKDYVVSITYMYYVIN